ncbi:MAG: peptidase S49 [Sphingomonas sp.]|nr:peptidase S49 [Sphingomonas sp.]|tara:strand:- start:181 stop:1059 length:879 start_codon:yes stop_codon:yes gene_type:complete
MNDMLAPTALWAMHPAFLDSYLKRGAIEAMLPEGLAALANMGKPAEAAKPLDPIREGATVVIPVRGMMAPSGIIWGAGTLTDRLADMIREFGADSKVGAIVLDIKSPGGLVYGTRELGDAVFEVRQSKPIVAVASPFSFSAAHWLATQGSAFYASPSAEVGSVGVRSGHVDQSGLEEKLGMKTTLIASHPDKIAAHPYAPLTDEDRAVIEADVAEMNAEFVSAIARGRGMKATDVPGVHGTGKTFSARRAAETGITDGVMTLREAVAKYSSSRSRMELMRRRAAVRGAAAAI